MVSGEICAALKSAQALPKAGDSFIQRGTKHTCSNRSDQPGVIAALQVGATH
ncbi:hypothetical protein K7711_19475 [Nocardia sp. CA2R105]|uniref:hypothetical protein n=1 Tax=Nocardia coffeae TaxID=2873381 RepID=UPI001CA63276|nr:hypothetical protein [Nocardia coffeae]MBY8858667.1 hypothetical protein [Nocardia coffeae]